jgi:hypothetical protein
MATADERTAVEELDEFPPKPIVVTPAELDEMEDFDGFTVSSISLLKASTFSDNSSISSLISSLLVVEIESPSISSFLQRTYGKLVR